MKFTLNIELGNDAMRTPHDIAEALSGVAYIMRGSTIPFVELTLPHSSVIRDANGNEVGRWEVTAPERRGFMYGWGEDPDLGRYAYSWHREHDVAAIWNGDTHIGITVAGEWHPGQSLYDVDYYEMISIRDDNGVISIPFSAAALTDWFRESGSAG